MSHADSAFFWVRLVAAFETWVTVTMPPNATRVAATAMIRRRPLNQPEFLDARRYLDLRIGDTFLSRDLDEGRKFGGYLVRKMRMVVMTPATSAAARTTRITVVFTPGTPVLLCAAASMFPSTGTGP